MQNELTQNNEECCSDYEDEESDHYCSDDDSEIQYPIKSMPIFSETNETKDINKNIDGKKESKVWWTLPKCMTENDQKNLLSETIQCHCKSFARICTVSKDGSNKGKIFFGCSNYDISTKKGKCNFFKWMEKEEEEKNLKKINDDEKKGNIKESSDNGTCDKREDVKINVNDNNNNNNDNCDMDTTIHINPTKKQKLNSDDGVKIILKIMKRLNKDDLKAIRKQVSYCIQKQSKTDCIYDRNLLQTEIENTIVKTFKRLQETKREGFSDNKNIIRVNNNQHFNFFYQNEKDNNVSNSCLNQLHRLHSIFHLSKINVKAMEVNINYARWACMVFFYMTTFDSILKIIDNDENINILLSERNKHIKKDKKNEILQWFVDHRWFHLETKDKILITLDDWNSVRDYIHAGKILHDASILIHCNISVLQFTRIFGLKKGRNLINKWKKDFDDIFFEPKYVSSINKICDVTLLVQ